MASREHMQPDRVLMARLYAACRPAVDLRARETGGYLIDMHPKAEKRSTLGSSINYNPRQA